MPQITADEPKGHRLWGFAAAAVRDVGGPLSQETLGLFDINRTIRPVGAAYRTLVEQWREILPTESLCLMNHAPEAAREDGGDSGGGRTS